MKFDNNNFERSLWREMKTLRFWIVVALGTLLVAALVILALAI